MIILIPSQDYMIHYTHQTAGLETIKNSPTPTMCDLDGGVQLTQVINLPRSPLPLILCRLCGLGNDLHSLLPGGFKK